MKTIYAFLFCFSVMAADAPALVVRSRIGQTAPLTEWQLSNGQESVSIRDADNQADGLFINSAPGGAGLTFQNSNAPVNKKVYNIYLNDSGNLEINSLADDYMGVQTHFMFSSDRWFHYNNIGDGQILYGSNGNGRMVGDSSFTFDPTSRVLKVSHNIGAIARFQRSTSGHPKLEFFANDSATMYLDVLANDSDTNKALKIQTRVIGGSVTIGNSGTLAIDSNITLNRTITAAGTTAVQTINKTAGRVNVAATELSKVVTNSLCTANSVVVATICTDDMTATIKSVVPAAGSFTITLTAAATCETAVNWVLFN